MSGKKTQDIIGGRKWAKRSVKKTTIAASKIIGAVKAEKRVTAPKAAAAVASDK